MSDLIDRQSTIDALICKMTMYPAEGLIQAQKAYVDCIQIIEGLPSALPMDVQEAYYRGQIDGIKECTAKLKRLNDNVNGRRTYG